MPLIQDEDSSETNLGQLTFRERLRTGRVVPIVSNRAIFDRMLGGYESFLASYARYVKYPFGQTRTAWSAWSSTTSTGRGKNR